MKNNIDTHNERKENAYQCGSHVSLFHALHDRSHCYWCCAGALAARTDGPSEPQHPPLRLVRMTHALDYVGCTLLRKSVFFFLLIWWVMFR